MTASTCGVGVRPAALLASTMRDQEINPAHDDVIGLARTNLFR